MIEVPVSWDQPVTIPDPEPAPILASSTPLRLQADYLRLRAEEKRLSIQSPESDEWKAKHGEMLDYIQSHKKLFK